MKYRIVYNGEYYRIQWRPWWLPIWALVEPSRLRGVYQPVNWSLYRFETVKDAEERIEELKELRKKRKWKVVEKQPYLDN